MQDLGQNFYNHVGINRDVNPFLAQASELYSSINWYSRIFGSKKVRFGYAKILDTIDNQPIRNLIYYDLGTSLKGILRVSDNKIYKYAFSGATWGSAIKTFTVDTVIPWAILQGTSLFLHFGNATDGYFTWDGTTIKNQYGISTPFPTVMTSWNSRIFADILKLSLAESAISFDLNGYSLTGTVALTQNDATVTGTSTLFLTELTTSMSLLIDGIVYRILSITSDTALELTANYTGSNITGKAAKTSYSADPFYLNSNDPAGGGTTSLTAGKDGQMIAMSSSVDRVNIYKQFGVYKFNGQTFFRMPYRGNILGVCSTKNDVDYFLATNGIYRNNGSQIEPADMGVQTIIEDTIRVHGITDPKMISVGNFTIFFIGTIRLGQGNNAQDITNGCLVHNEKFDQWDIWSLADTMTAFGFYVDATTNEQILISGDDKGNVYRWGEEYSTDNGVAIAYHLRTHYNNFGDPYKEKSPDRYAVALDNGDGAVVQVATDYKDDFGGKEQSNAPGFLTKDFFNNKVRDFQAIALQIMGSTKTNRPEFHGYSIGFKDMDDRPIASKNQRRS